MNITDRQKKLMLAIIEEFTKSANPVGSEELKELYDFDFSPATIRNELADLAKEGLLYKEHSSSGRTPTTLAWRYYISDYMEEDNLDPMRELAIREKLFKHRFSIDRLVKETIDELGNFTRYLGIGIVQNMYKSNYNSPIYLSGTANLLDYREYQNLESLKKVLHILENSSLLLDIFGKSKVENDVCTLIGEEIGLEAFAQSALVFQPIKLGSQEKLYICVLGPSRMNYSKVIPAVRVVVQNIKDATVAW